MIACAEIRGLSTSGNQSMRGRETRKGIGFEVLIEAIAQSSRRLEAMYFGVADYAASTPALTTVIGGVDVDYGVLTEKDASGNRGYPPGLRRRGEARRGAAGHEGKWAIQPPATPRRNRRSSARRLGEKQNRKLPVPCDGA
jgi:hypothetical protein